MESSGTKRDLKRNATLLKQIKNEVKDIGSM
jgi:hypothetical protein